MAEQLQPLLGVKSLVFFREFDKRGSVKGKKIAFQTENELSEKSKTDSEETKDGSLLKSKGLDSEISCTSYVEGGGSADYKEITEALRNQKLMEIWIVDVDIAQGTGEYNTQYFRGVLSEKKDKAQAEGYVEMEITFTIQGKGKFGHIDVSSFIEGSTEYEFTDLEVVPTEMKLNEPTTDKPKSK